MMAYMSYQDAAYRTACTTPGMYLYTMHTSSVKADIPIWVYANPCIVFEELAPHATVVTSKGDNKPLLTRVACSQTPAASIRNTQAL
jgi:hypothetical protein